MWGMLAVSVLAMGVSTGPKALHVFAVYIGRNDNAEYKVSRDRYAIYFCDRQTDFRKEPSVIHIYSTGVHTTVQLCTAVNSCNSLLYIIVQLYSRTTYMYSPQQL